MADFFDSIVTPLQDILKYSIVKFVNTGDKILDNLINVIILAVLTFFTTKSTLIAMIRFNIYYYIAKFKNIPCYPISNRYHFYFKYIYDTKPKYKAVLSAMNKKFNAKLYNYYIGIAETKVGLQFDTERKRFIFKESSNFSSLNLGNAVVFIYSTLNDVIGLEFYNTEITLSYTNQILFNEFIDMIDNLIPSICDNMQVVDQYYIEIDDRKTIINPKKTFDRFVSKHKNMLLTYLDKITTDREIYNGFFEKNLGIMLSGPPGTGKTYLIFAICNYLKRNAKIIDMRKIRTRMDFINIFKQEEISRTVYVFDEFDFVQGVIRSRDSDQDAEPVNTLAQLKQTKMQLLDLISKKDNSDQIKKEYEEVCKDIINYENKICLDTILQTLSGLEEHTGRVIVATTNYLDKIDPALLREGRFSCKFKLEQFNQNEIVELLMKMYKGFDNEEYIYELINQTQFQENKFTPTKIIDLVISSKNIDDVIAVLKK